MARLQAHFREKLVPQLQEKFGYASAMQVPRITQDHTEHGCERGRGRTRRSWITLLSDMTKIAGQKPVVTKTKQVDCHLQGSPGRILSVAW
jgi:large subunit ribosomal protein L5